ncbi:MAG: flippase-like domain-containing protein [Myxococcales bacterium]|nr:flippase-like domain-containing protein [Myxococcales bacterium]
MGDPAKEGGETSLARRILPKLVLSIALGGLLAWLVQRSGVDIIPHASSFAHVRWWTVGAYTGVLLVTHFFRASRWRFLIEPVKRDIPFWDGVLLNWIGFFAIFALPLRLGELARPALTKMRHQVSISAGLGTVAVERVIDGLVASVCVVWALVAIPQIEGVTDPIALSVPYYGAVAVGVFVAAFAGLVLFLWQRELATKLVHWTFGRVSKRLGEQVAEKVAGVADGVRSVGHLRLATGFTVETLIYWGTNALGMWLLGWGCGIEEMTFGHAVAVMGILAIGILLPAAPGLFGSFQLAVSTALKLYFVSAVVEDQGTVYIFLMFLVQALVISIAGLVPLYAMHLRFSDLLRPPSPDPSP